MTWGFTDFPKHVRVERLTNDQVHVGSSDIGAQLVTQARNGNIGCWSEFSVRNKYVSNGTSKNYLFFIFFFFLFYYF